MNLVMRKPITVVRRTETVGADRRPTATTASSTVYGALRHRLDDSAYDGGDIVQQEQIVYLPAGTSVAPGDTLQFDGDDWTVIGNPYEAYSHRKQAVHHLEVRVRVGKR